jgi:WD40 repeat protein
VDLDTARAAELAGHQNWVWSVAFLPDGKRAVSAGGGTNRGGTAIAGEDFAIRLWALPEAGR